MTHQPNGKATRRRPRRKPHHLAGKLKSGETPEMASARLVVAGLGPNAAAAWEWSAYPFGEVEKRVDLTAVLNAIASERVNGGDLGDAEALLTAQTVALNAVFVNLAHRATVANYIDHFDRHLRLALKAQSQCRATCEALAVLKNPPVFTRQANIASQQVVNNGTIVGGSRARDLQTAQNGLLEAHGQRLDDRTTDQTSGRDPALAAVDALDRPADTKGQGAVITERLPRRSETHSARDRVSASATHRRQEADSRLARRGDIASGTRG